MTGRLIDADALKEKYTRNGDYENSIYDGANVVKTIDEQPTVDAIPVEWLKENFPISGVYGTERYFRTAHAVEDILKDWETEKEKRKEE